MEAGSGMETTPTFKSTQGERKIRSTINLLLNSAGSTPPQTDLHSSIQKDLHSISLIQKNQSKTHKLYLYKENPSNRLISEIEAFNAECYRFLSPGEDGAGLTISCPHNLICAS